MSDLPPLIFFSLTPEEEDDTYPQSPQDYEQQEESINWIEDSECQENLFHIVSLTPEETMIDKDNHCIISYTLFFEELGYFTEEPEPIDITRDYEQEAKELFEKRDMKKPRQKHVDLSRIPSLEYHSRSGLSSSSSSIHHEQLSIADIRSPHYLGLPHHQTTSMADTSYHYGNHDHYKHHPYHHHHQQNYRPSRLH